VAVTSAVPVAPRLIVVTDTTVAPQIEAESRIARVLDAARARTVMVQLRDKELTTRERMALGQRLVAVCRAREQYFVVNDRIDLAVLLGADGVHLGEGGVEPSDARCLLPAGAWISKASHEPESVARSDANVILLSPVMAPRKGRAPLGVEGLRRARQILKSAGDRTTPALYALGGVDAESAAECLAAGTAGVAVVGAVLDGRDVRPLLDVLGILV